jgi:hypothetical protein
LGIFNSLAEIQLKSSLGTTSEEEFALNNVKNLISKVLKEFNVHNFLSKFNISEALSVVIHREILFSNILIHTIRLSLLTLKKD